MKTAFLTVMILALLVGSFAAYQSTAQPTVTPTSPAPVATKRPTVTPTPLPPTPTIVSEQDAGTTITLKTGDTFLIKLDGNITTGFNWIPAPQDPVLLNQVGETEVTPESDKIGAPGKIVLRFKAVGQGQTLLHLDYKRSWETDVAPEKTFEVTVVVK